MQGDKGDKGETGAQGVQGIQGETGASGKSAYQSYLDTTTDNPKMTEAQWANIYGGKQDKLFYEVATYADIAALCVAGKYRMFYVASDETNDGEPTRYDWDGANLNWVITQKV